MDISNQLNRMDTQTKITLDDIIKKKLSPQQLREYNRIHYGQETLNELYIDEDITLKCKEKGIDIAGYNFPAAKEESRPPRRVKVGLIQHSIVLPTDKLVNEQRKAIFSKVSELIDIAASAGVQILCLQEAWSMPFFLCTGERKRWSDFAESATDGPSTKFLQKIAQKNKMVIISPILENDHGVWWNTAVVIDENGKYMGKHRKNHLPSVGSFSEIGYYEPGNMGHAVFDTTYGKIAVNICYGRHHALNWLMFGLNGAEIVFNPAATISEFGESFWGIEARNAAIANNYFTCSINRVGTEVFNVKKDEIREHNTMTVSRTYYGSSYITAPNGCRTPSLSRVKDGLLLGELDLNLCRQVKDRWGFNMTSRLDLYAKELAHIVQ
ncbi:beta-ureidopropionase-like [Ostrinia nubilalis]|uniref:beta-ureidopropionase-like n=1 Tax=Ostrinia nubilalis TaxID=29057 RepID=UPI0030824A3F